MPSKPTEQEMTEILARFMERNEWYWSPFNDRNTIAGIEARLSDEQWRLYEDFLVDDEAISGTADLFKAIRHASPAICAEALARVFEPGRFE